MAVEWLDKTFEAGQDLIHYACVLESLGSAMSRLGMTKAADELWQIAECIRASQKQIRDAISKEVADECRRSEEATANMLAAALAGIKLGKGEPTSTALDG